MYIRRKASEKGVNDAAIVSASNTATTCTTNTTNTTTGTTVTMIITTGTATLFSVLII